MLSQWYSRVGNLFQAYLAERDVTDPIGGIRTPPEKLNGSPLQSFRLPASVLWMPDGAPRSRRRGYGQLKTDDGTDLSRLLKMSRGSMRNVLVKSVTTRRASQP